MKKILLLCTGGTIGSSITRQNINVDNKATSFLLDLYAKQYTHSQVEFTVRQPLTILSENLVPFDWEYLIRGLHEELTKNNYDGVIITHGTDTLPYTAAAISYQFFATKIPILLIASNSPVVNEESDGFINFVAAINIIQYDPLSKVLVIFQNYKQELTVYLGARMSQSIAFKHDYDHFSDLNLGTVHGERFSINKSPYIDADLLSEDNRDADNIQFSNQFSDQILHIKPYPGLRYEYFQFKEKPKAILHGLYHSGTASTKDKYSLIEFIHYCTNMGIDFYITPIEKKATAYATTHDILKAGAIPIYNMLTEASVVKLMLAYGNKLDRKQTEFFLNSQTIAHEHIVKRQVCEGT